MNIEKKELTQSEIHRVLCYNPLSGNFMWRVALGKRIKVGGRAGTTCRNYQNGRLNRRIRIHGRAYSAHILAFIYMRGYWPSQEIDHKDRDGLNNRWLNLREATHSQNQANSGLQKNNKLGIKGVCLRTNGKYHAKIDFNCKRYHLGDFNTSEAASRAYWKAAKKYFGEFTLNAQNTSAKASSP